MTPEDVRRGVECLLFVSGSPLGAREMALALEVDEKEVAEAARELVERDLSRSGLKVEKVAGGWRMITRPEYARAVARFVGKRAQKLSRAALEVLAVIAYNQPCTQPEVEAIRGVDSTGVLKSLMERGLVREVGRKEAPGRPILYSTTDEFLVYFGLNSLADLPEPGAGGIGTLPLDLEEIDKNRVGLPQAEALPLAVQENVETRDRDRQNAGIDNEADVESGIAQPEPTLSQ